LTERALLVTGIGGQGIQLAARTLAVAAVADGLEAMLFGEYGGVMRGGNSDATVVLGTGRLLMPPTASRAWGAMALHHEYWPEVEQRLHPMGIVIIDASVFRGEIERPDLTVIRIEATTKAAEMGNVRGASMIVLGAFAAATGLVSPAALVAATAEVFPSYRAQHAAANAEAIRAGYDLVQTRAVEAWPERAVGAAQ
jgi:2-oxoglutarate ferredoxin oxidoreductase subunit gamma